MPFLFKKTSRGKEYYFIGHNKKVNGVSKREWEVYIGPVEKILQMKQRESKKLQVQEIQVFEFGISAIMFDLFNRLGLRELANHYTNKNRDQGIDVGSYLMLMTLNQCVDSKSKRSLVDWYKKSFLRRHTNIPTKRMTSQRFWDHMNYFSAEIIKQIQEGLIQRLVTEFDINFDNLLYDPTNFSTYIRVHPNRGNELPQKGHSKNKRFDLLQINLALLVTREDGIPLFHEIYRGNINDCTEFKTILKHAIDWHQKLSHSQKDLTLIFDKGNNSKGAFDIIAESPYHFVGSLRPSTQKDLLTLSLAHFEESWTDAKKRTTKAHRLQRKVYNVERTLIVTWHEPSAKKSRITLESHLLQAEQKLQALQMKIGQTDYKTLNSIKNKAQKILSKKQIKGLIDLEVMFQKQSSENQFPVLKWQRNLDAIEQHQISFGRSVLFTDRADWSTREIVQAYRSQWRVERNFRELKDPDCIKADPPYHWTDNNLRVHYFICVLALLLKRLLHRHIRNLGLDWSLERIMKTLRSIEEVAIKVTAEPGIQYKITKLNHDQKQLFDLLQLNKYSIEPVASH